MNYDDQFFRLILVILFVAPGLIIGLVYISAENNASLFQRRIERLSREVLLKITDQRQLDFFKRNPLNDYVIEKLRSYNVTVADDIPSEFSRSFEDKKIRRELLDRLYNDFLDDYAKYARRL